MMTKEEMEEVIQIQEEFINELVEAHRKVTLKFVLLRSSIFEEEVKQARNSLLPRFLR